MEWGFLVGELLHQYNISTLLFLPGCQPFFYDLADFFCFLYVVMQDDFVFFV